MGNGRQNLTTDEEARFIRTQGSSDFDEIQTRNLTLEIVTPADLLRRPTRFSFISGLVNPCHTRLETKAI